MLLLSALLIGCGGNDEPGHVVVLGDSLVFQADGNRAPDDANRLLVTALEEEGSTVEGGGLIGLSVPAAYESLWPTIEEQAPDVLVVALGTNDSRDGAIPLETSRQALTVWLEEVPSSCVVLVGVNEGTSTWGLDVYGPPFNAMLEDVAADHPDVRVVQWDPDPAMLGQDGVHLTEVGRVAYRRLIVDAAESCLSSA